MDLYRAILIILEYNNSSQKMIKFVNKGFATKIDERQSVLDMNHFCLEIHVVTTKVSVYKEYNHASSLSK